MCSAFKCPLPLRFEFSSRVPGFHGSEPDFGQEVSVSHILGDLSWLFPACCFACFDMLCFVFNVLDLCCTIFYENSEGCRDNYGKTMEWETVQQEMEFGHPFKCGLRM